MFYYGPIFCLRLFVQVHGGTTEDDIVKFLMEAEKCVKNNRSKNMDTVVFFDEANTTDAIGLIKEIMCDRRVRGQSVSQDLKFIAACNPYIRSFNFQCTFTLSFVVLSRSLSLCIPILVA